MCSLGKKLVLNSFGQRSIKLSLFKEQMCWVRVLCFPKGKSHWQSRTNHPQMTKRCEQQWLIYVRRWNPSVQKIKLDASLDKSKEHLQIVICDSMDDNTLLSPNSEMCFSLHHLPMCFSLQKLLRLFVAIRITGRKIPNSFISIERRFLGIHLLLSWSGSI